MEKPPDTFDYAGHALELHRMTLRLVPLLPRTKSAFTKNWPALELSEADVRYWAARGVNWGIITGDPLVVLETDSDEAEEWVRKNGIDSPVVVRSGSGRGLHRYFLSPEGVELRGKIKLHGVPGLDLKAWHGYIVAAGSIHPETGHRYDYLPGKELRDVGELPVLNLRWVREQRPQRAGDADHQRYERLPKVDEKIRNLRAYIRGVPSFQGSYGSKGLLRVCLLLVEDGLCFEEALKELEDWNEEVPQPPWSPRELVRALGNAFNRKMSKTVTVFQKERT